MLPASVTQATIDESYFSEELNANEKYQKESPWPRISLIINAGGYSEGIEKKLKIFQR